MIQKEKVLFYGACSEVVTPFTERGAVDHKLLRGEIDFMIDSGITGFFVNGLASESLMMNAEDRIAAVATVLDAAKSRVPVMCNVVANSINEGVEITKRYAEMGADAICITPPILYKYTEDGIIDYYKTLASSSNLPVYIYNAPETGNKLSPLTVAHLFQMNEGFRGYKDSTQNIIEQQTLLHYISKERHFELLAGSDAQIVTTMMLGGVGVISLITVVFPQLIIDTVAAAQQGDWDKAIILQGKVLRVREALKIGPFMAAYKYVGEKIGHPLGKMKRPLSEVSNKDKVVIDSMLAQVGLI